MTTVLVVDDEQAIRDLLRLALERAGHTVLDACNGEHGIEKLTEHPVDLMITDIVMPKKEGIETIKDARSRYPDLKIIAISGGGSLRGGNIVQQAFLPAAKQNGADLAFAKPFNPKDIVAAVDELTQRADRQSSTEIPNDNEWVQTYLRKLRDCSESARNESQNSRRHLSDLCVTATEMRDQSADRGFRLVVRVLDLLCKFVDATNDPGERHIDFIDLHLDALHAINAGNAGDEKSSIAQMLLMDLESAASKIARHYGDHRRDPVS